MKEILKGIGIGCLILSFLLLLVRGMMLLPVTPRPIHELKGRTVVVYGREYTVIHANWYPTEGKHEYCLESREAKLVIWDGHPDFHFLP